MNDTQKTYIGVHIEMRRGTNRQWRAIIYRNGKTAHLGYFDTFEEAKKARIEAEEEKKEKSSLY